MYVKVGNNTQEGTVILEIAPKVLKDWENQEPNTTIDLLDAEAELRRALQTVRGQLKNRAIQLVKSNSTNDERTARIIFARLVD